MGLVSPVVLTYLGWCMHKSIVKHNSRYICFNIFYICRKSCLGKHIAVALCRARLDSDWSLATSQNIFLTAAEWICGDWDYIKMFSLDNEITLNCLFSTYTGSNRTENFTNDITHDYLSLGSNFPRENFDHE